MTDIQKQDPQASSTKTQTFAGLNDIVARMREFRQEYGQDAVKALTIPVGGEVFQFVIRKPSRLDYERYNETTMKIREGKVAQAMSASRTLVLTCTLAPGTEAVAAALDKYAALPEKLAEPLLALAGADAEVREETF